MNNDSLGRIKLDSKEVIVKSCQIFKAKFVNSRIKQNGCRCGSQRAYLNIRENVFCRCARERQVKLSYEMCENREQHILYIIQ